MAAITPPADPIARMARSYTCIAAGTAHGRDHALHIRWQVAPPNDNAPLSRGVVVVPTGNRWASAGRLLRRALRHDFGRATSRNQHAERGKP